MRCYLDQIVNKKDIKPAGEEGGSGQEGEKEGLRDDKESRLQYILCLYVIVRERTQKNKYKPRLESVKILQVQGQVILSSL